MVTYEIIVTLTGTADLTADPDLKKTLKRWQDAMLALYNDADGDVSKLAQTDFLCKNTRISSF